MNLVMLFTGGEGFPLGDAYTNRVLSISKGLVKNGCNITILIMYPGRKNPLLPEGVFDGIGYKLMGGAFRPENNIQKIIVGIKGIFNTCGFIFNQQKKKKYDAVISFSESFFQNLFVFLISKLINIPFIRENNEFPKVVIKKGLNNLSAIDRFRLNYSYKIYDGNIFISHSLKNYYETKTRKKSLIEIVPIVVDNNRFSFADNLESQKWITYCGNLFGEKDGVEILIEAFAVIAYKYPEFKLILIGDIQNTAEYKNLKRLIESLNIASQVEFTGYLNRDIVPRFLQQSAILVLARPDNIQAKGGFPTKLGEYLATGRPVLVTSVGDIPKYIVDGQNGYLAVPGSVDDFSKKLDFILKNYVLAEKIGLEGKKLTLNAFNNEYQAIRIITFISKVIELHRR